MKPNELLHASSIMAVGTIISRITGFIRNILAAAVLGTALLADTYNVANTMPNILYNLLVGGALTAIFVPQLIRSFGDADGGHAFASKLVTTISTVLLALVVVGVIFAPLLVRFYAPEFATKGFENEFHLAVAFTRYCLPQIFFMGLFTMLGQVANARGSFAPLMWAPIVNNLTVIAVFVTVLIDDHGHTDSVPGMGHNARRCSTSSHPYPSGEAHGNQPPTEVWVAGARKIFLSRRLDIGICTHLTVGLLDNSKNFYWSRSTERKRRRDDGSRLYTFC
jgi:hypothetical protein